jgi:hypothetical protein
MNFTRKEWPEWKKAIQNSGFTVETAVLLETLAPFGFILSQVIYLSAWLFPAKVGFGGIKNFAVFIEDDDEVRQFAQFLKVSGSDVH